MSKGQAPGWDLAVPRPVRELAKRAANDDGTRVAFYVTELIVADAKLRGLPVPALAEPSVAHRVRSYVREHGPVHVGAVVRALGLRRIVVDAVLSRSVAKGLLERVEGGIAGVYRAPRRGSDG